MDAGALLRIAEMNRPRKHFNLPQGGPVRSHVRDSFKQFLHYENACWLCRCIVSHGSINYSKKLEKVNCNKFHSSLRGMCWAKQTTYLIKGWQ